MNLTLTILGRLAPIACLWLGGTAGTALAEDWPEQELVAGLRAVPPMALLSAAAETNRISLDAMDPFEEGGGLEPGDSTAALVTYRDRVDRMTQWLVHLETADPKPEEAPGKLGKPLVLHTTSGNKLEFIPSPSFVQLRTLGPFAQPDARGRTPKPAIETARFTINQDYLALGLDKAAAVIYRLREVKHEGLEAAFSFAPEPFTDAEVEKGRKLNEALRITPVEERALAGAIPMLLSYFEVVQRSAGLEEILMRILDKPSLWSVIRHGGVRVNFEIQSGQTEPVDAAPWGVAGGQAVYRFPLLLELNDKPALKIILFATAPRPPLLACGGIVGMLATPPSGGKTALLLRIVSARHGTRERSKRTGL